MVNEIKYQTAIEVTKGDGSEDSVSGYWVEGYEVYFDDSVRIYVGEYVVSDEDDYMVDEVFVSRETLMALFKDLILDSNGYVMDMSWIGFSGNTPPLPINSEKI